MVTIKNWGALFALTLLASAMTAIGLKSGDWDMLKEPAFAAYLAKMIASGAVLGLTGAHIRRILSQRQTSKRDRTKRIADPV